MSKKLIIVLAFAALLSIASCRVARRDAPNTKPEITATDIYEEVSNGLKAFQNTVMEVLGVKNTDELQQKVAATGKDIAAKLDSWAVEIKKDTEHLKDLPAIKSLQETAEKTLQEFKAKNPETAEDLKALYEKATKGTEEVVEKIKALGDSEDANKLKEISKKLLESASNTVQNIAKDVQENFKKE